MKEQHNILISGCFDVLAGKVIRLGHMGNNANIEDMADTLEALEQTVASFGMKIKKSMKETFLENSLLPNEKSDKI